MAGLIFIQCDDLGSRMSRVLFGCPLALLTKYRLSIGQSGWSQSSNYARTGPVPRLKKPALLSQWPARPVEATRVKKTSLLQTTVLIEAGQQRDSAVQRHADLPGPNDRSVYWCPITNQCSGVQWQAQILALNDRPVYWDPMTCQCTGVQWQVSMLWLNDGTDYCGRITFELCPKFHTSTLCAHIVCRMRVHLGV